MPRQRVVWMGMGLVRAWLQSLRLLLDVAPSFAWLVNLSMQDYPLRPRDAIAAELCRAPGRNYVTCEPLAALPFHIRRRPWLMAFEGRDRLIRTPLPRAGPERPRIAWKGSWWHVLDRAFCCWIVEDLLPRRYLAFLANVQAPDELVVQNLLMASPFRDAGRTGTGTSSCGRGQTVALIR